MDMPFSEACERNKAPILAELVLRFARARRVLEIGSGTGQHALHFAAALPHLTWQCCDVPANLPALRCRLDQARQPNLPPPWPFEVGQALPQGQHDAVFTANTLHIIRWIDVRRVFDALGRWLPPGAVLSVYGPFNYAGRFTSDGNARFDASLRAADPARGIRDFEAVDALARHAGLRLQCDQAMPAHNRCITWQAGVALR
jgi:SAM-dependent methyltransferase